MHVKNAESPLSLSRFDNLKEAFTKAKEYAFTVRVLQFVTYLLACLHVNNAESQLLSSMLGYVK